MIAVYGASDDLIEVEGDISAEFSHMAGEALLAFSDGTILRVCYADTGVWRISPVMTGTSRVEITAAPEDDPDNYTDRATLNSDTIRWVVYGSEHTARRSPHGARV